MTKDLTDRQKTRMMFFLLILSLRTINAFITNVSTRHDGYMLAKPKKVVAQHHNRLLRFAAIAPEVEEEVTIPRTVQHIWNTTPNLKQYPEASFPLNGNDDISMPFILRIPNFLSAKECETVIDWAILSISNGAAECDEYLNARVNKEVDNQGYSEEGKTLIEEFKSCLVKATDRGGFRLRTDRSLIETMFKERILDLLGMSIRNFVYEEGAWIRPTPRTVVVRDCTVVYYTEGNGVPPHVDGRDATLLIYLNDVPDGAGGRTVFPEENFAQNPVEGTALLYRSKKELLHYSEPMHTKGHHKWIMQFLLDFTHNYRPGDTIVNFQTGESYIWDGSR